MNKKILASLVTVAVVLSAVAYGTSAFFSDTETSTGNVLAAGAIDLRVDNHSYIDQTGKGLVENPGTTWGVSDLGPTHKFFNFTDLKPGDLGEDTISLHVSSNPAWVCADVTLTANDDVTCNDPELDDDATCAEPNDNLYDGDLAQALNFVFWKDDGDNVYECTRPEQGDPVCEEVLTQGPASGVLNGAHWSLFDSSTGGPTDPEKVYFIGKAWCFGELTKDPVLQDGFPGQPNNGPDVRGAGVDCDGSQVNNAAQTDVVKGDISFRAVQARHNDPYFCNPQE